MNVVTAQIRQSHLRELAIALHWAVSDEVMLLWGYFDESGEHAQPSGHEVRLTLGGGWAPLENWQTLGKEWMDVLKSLGIAVFHMSEFDAPNGRYSCFTKTEKHTLLNGLLDVIARNVRDLVCFSNPADGSSIENYQRSYDAGVVDVVLEGMKIGNGCWHSFCSEPKA